MQGLTIFMIVAVTTVNYLVTGDKWGRPKILPGVCGFIPELLGAIALGYVVVVGTRSRFQFIRPAYWLIFLGLGLTAACGIINNEVQSGTIVAGMRAYLRALPWFFVPVAFAFSEGQVKQQLRVVLIICLIQIPIAIDQRLSTGDDVTGDWTTGTIMDSGSLSIFLVGAVCVLASLYERRQLSLGKFVLLFFLILVPTTINETKVMVVILPVSLLVSYMCASRPEVRSKRFVMAVLLLSLFGALFVSLYNLTVNQGAPKIEEFLSDEQGQSSSYLFENKEIGSQGMARRGDAVLVPLQNLLKDPVRLAFGYGIGNVSSSNLGPGFAGAYWRLWDVFLETAFSRFVLELGVLGVGLLLLLYYFIFEDCLALARRRVGFYSAFAAGWSGVVVLITISTFYTQIQLINALSFLFWYFSGLIAAQRIRASLANSAAESHQHAQFA